MYADKARKHAGIDAWEDLQTDATRFEGHVIAEDVAACVQFFNGQGHVAHDGAASHVGAALDRVERYVKTTDAVVLTHKQLMRHMMHPPQAERSAGIQL
jgi:hypothetical protein